jgi:hypothetical protein
VNSVCRLMLVGLKIYSNITKLIKFACQQTKKLYSSFFYFVGT